MTDLSTTTVQPMEGHGAYNRGSRVQASGLLPAIALLEQAAKEVSLPSGTIVIADYGASEGRNSLLPMAAAIAALRRRLVAERPVSVVHTDLPGNDFAALFETLETDPDSYLRVDSAAFASAVGRSFYQQILPSSSVTLGWSSWAVQWLSRVPGIVPDQVQVAYSSDVGARDAFAHQAAEDWRAFLKHREAEMREGARLVVLTMAISKDGNFGYQPLLDCMYGALLEMTDCSFLSLDEVRRMAIPTIGRTEAEFRAPFSDPTFAGLELRDFAIFDAEDRIWATFEADSDAAAFGEAWARFCRASVFPTLAAALDGGPTDPRAPDFMARLEAGLASRLAAAPSRIQVPLAMMQIVKRSQLAP